MARIFKPAKKPNSHIQEKAPGRLTIDSLSLEGRGVARHQNKTVFVAGALPGETVTVSHYRRHKRYSECETRDVVTESELRVKPFCAAYARCGGCQLQHLAEAPQLQLKQQALLEQLEHQLGHSKFEVLSSIESTKAYRSRARIGVSKTGKLGFREKQSSELVDIDTCPILERELQSVWRNLQTWLESCERRPKLGHIELVRGDSSAAVVLRVLETLNADQMQKL
ncbi:MAG: TRAM domain-containing protein, partial [Pseudomonadota bacterium]|nr:TRAM domain-containing protein [Pseudomonadota bacterium]